MSTGKCTLIIAKTFDEAQGHALEYGLRDWLFVTSIQDLTGADPETHALEFAGHWYERDDLKRLRENICGRGFDPPHLSRMPRIPVRLLLRELPRNGVNDDAENERADDKRNKATEH